MNHTKLQRQPLTAAHIVYTALAMIDEEGLEQLSIRRLGDALGVQGMAVYRHVSNKDDILDGVRRLLVEEFAERMSEAAPFADWREHLRTFGTAYRAVALAHPRAFPLLATSAEKAWAHGRDIAGAALAALTEAGFDDATAIGAERIVIRYVIGFSLIDAANQAEDQGPAPNLTDIDRSHPLVGRLVRSLDPPQGDDALFHLGLGLILDGLSARLGGGG